MHFVHVHSAHSAYKVMYMNIIMLVKHHNPHIVHTIQICIFVGEVSGKRSKGAPGQEANGEECQAWIFRSKLVLYMTGVHLYAHFTCIVLCNMVCMYMGY